MQCSLMDVLPYPFHSDYDTGQGCPSENAETVEKSRLETPTCLRGEDRSLDCVYPMLLLGRHTPATGAGRAFLATSSFMRHRP